MYRHKSKTNIDSRNFKNEHSVLSGLHANSDFPNASENESLNIKSKNILQKITQMEQSRKEEPIKQNQMQQLDSMRELSKRLLYIKRREWGPMKGIHVSPTTTQEVVQTVRLLKRKAKFPVGQALKLLDLPRATYFRWAKTDGKPKRPKPIPRGHWLLPWEREAIIDYQREHPELSYRRLAYKMLDDGVVAVSPISVYRVLKKTGFNSSKQQRIPSGVHKANFKQSARPHEQWHIHIAYLRIKHDRFLFAAVIDGFSRYIVHHEVHPDSAVVNKEFIIEKALKNLPNGITEPRFFSSGGRYLLSELRDYLNTNDIHLFWMHMPYFQTKHINDSYVSAHRDRADNRSKINTDEIRRLIAKYVNDYNHRRLQNSLHYLTAADYLQGIVHVQHRLAERRAKIKAAAQIRRDYHRKRLDPTGKRPVREHKGLTPPKSN